MRFLALKKNGRVMQLSTDQQLNRASQSGVGLVEVLVALVVLSVGLLGIAALYVTTLQAKTTSGSRMKAVNFAYDMADRIRANPAGANPGGGADSYYKIAQGGTTTLTNCATATCSAQQMAASDLYQWVALVTNASTGLSGATYEIDDTHSTDTTPEILTINLGWTEANSGTLNYSLQVQISKVQT